MKEQEMHFQFRIDIETTLLTIFKIRAYTFKIFSNQIT